MSRRNKGIVCVILGILVCGILITSYTRSLLREQERNLAAAPEGACAGEEEPVQARLYMDGMAVPETGAGTGQNLETENSDAYAPALTALQGDASQPAEASGVAGETATDEAAEADETAPVPETASAEEPAASSRVLISPAAAQAGGFSAEVRCESAAGQAEGQQTESQSAEASIAADEAAGPGVSLGSSGGTDAGSEKKTAADFRRRLEEIDSQIEDQRSRNEAYTTYDMWTMAENERKLWDGELNNIYNTIKDHVPDDQVEALVKEERAWIVERDAKAAEDAGKYEGGTLESVEYSASLAASTRERAYALVETYGEYLW